MESRMFSRRVLVGAILLLTVGVACQSTGRRAHPPKQSVRVTVVDEQGAQVATASMRAIGNSKPIEIRGTRELKIDQPVAGTIEADGFLSEPFVLDPKDGSVTVKMFSRVGKSGTEGKLLQPPCVKVTV